MAKCKAGDAFRSRKCQGDVGPMSPLYACDVCSKERRYCEECAATWIMSLAEQSRAKQKRKSTLHDVIVRVNHAQWYRKGLADYVQFQKCECGGILCPSENIPTCETLMGMKPPTATLGKAATPYVRKGKGQKSGGGSGGGGAPVRREPTSRELRKAEAERKAIEEVKAAIELRKREAENKHGTEIQEETEVGASREEDMPVLEQDPPPPDVEQRMHEHEERIREMEQQMRQMQAACTASLTRMQAEVIDVCSRLNAKIVRVSGRVDRIEVPSWMTDGSSNFW